MIFRKIVFVLVTIIFASIAWILVGDLKRNKKKLDKQRKNSKSKSNTKTTGYR
jgi:hypothetical protein